MKRSILFLLFANMAFAQQYIDDYFPFERKWAPTVNPANGAVVGGWARTPDRIYWASGGTTTNLNWSSVANSEIFEIRHNCADGQSYLFLNAYAPHNNPVVPPGRKWWIKTTKALITVGGVTYNITNVANGTGGCVRQENNLNGSGTSHKIGMPFAPYKFYNQSYRIQLWGVISNHHGVFHRDFYWDAFWEPYQTGHNACWTGSGSSTRSTINLTEAYWDGINGWSIGGGSIGANGVPTGNGISYGRTIGYGQNAGPNWTFVDLNTGGQQCIHNLYSW